MDHIANPYRPGAGSPPPALVGRDELIADVVTALERARLGRPDKSLMPIGLRGVGKTVLLNRFVELANERQYVTAMLEAPETDNFRYQLATKLRKALIALQHRNPLSAAVARTLGVLRSFTLSASTKLTNEGPAFSIDVDPVPGEADSGNLSEDLSDLFFSVGEAAATHGLAVLVAIDELQYLNEEELGALIAAVHRTTQKNLPLVLVGAGLPQLPGLAGEAKSYAERLFRFPVIGELTPDDSRRAIATPAEELGVSFTPDALDEIVTATRGYPYFLQQWSYRIWNEASASPVTVDDVKSAAPLIQRELDQNFFRVRFERLTPSERRYLRAMAERGPGSHRSGDIARTYGAKVESVAPMRNNLIGKGMIYSPAHGDTAFTVPLFDEFLRRELPFEPSSRA
jgi:hypothetical protein